MDRLPNHQLRPLPEPARNMLRSRRGIPVGLLKAVKHPAEVEGYRRAMLRDGVAMVKFLKWLIPAVQAGGQTELSISRKLEELRSEQDLFCGNSFDTIAGYAPPRCRGPLRTYSGNRFGTPTEGTVAARLGRAIRRRHDGYHPHHRPRPGERGRTPRLYLSLERTHPAGPCQVPERLQRYATRRLRPLCHVAGRHQLSSRHRTWCGFLPVRARRSSSNPHELYAVPAPPLHDRDQRTGHLQRRAAWHTHRKHADHLALSGNRGSAHSSSSTRSPSVPSTWNR